MNITIDDASPQMLFTSTTPAGNSWNANHNGDPTLPNYFEVTYHATYYDDDTMTLNFNGTAIYVYGSKLPDHGAYLVQLDGGSRAEYVGFAAQYQYQQVIYSAGGLDPKVEHTINIVSKPSNTSPAPNATAGIVWWLDIDYVVITTGVTGQVYTTTYDDGSGAFTFSDGWTARNTTSSYSNGTSHLTYNVGNSFSFGFNGSSVQLFGGTNFDHGNYSVSLDGMASQVYNGTAYTMLSQVPLYTASNLEEGSHNLVVTNIGGGPGATSSFVFDYAVVNSTISPDVGNSTTVNATSSNVTSSAGNTTSSNTTSYTSTNHAAPIAGGVVGGVLGAALIAFLLWFFLFRRKHRYNQAQNSEPVDLNGGPNNSDHVEGTEITPFNPNASGAQSSQYGNSSAYDSTRSPASPPMVQAGAPFLTVVPPPPASNATSYPRSPDSPTPQQGFGARGASGAVPTAGSSGGTASAYSAAPSSSRGPSATSGAGTPPLTPGNARRSKTAGVPVPYTGQRPNLPSPPIETRAEVYGRERDMGPAPFSDEGHNDEEMLPPDYQQATQPLPGQRPPSSAG